MPATFSINVGTITEATRKEDIFSVLNDIQDNSQKLISPRDVRDAFLSSWASSAFKLTNASTTGIEYIGLDSSNPENRDIKSKIYLGKRSYGSLDIMNSSLLNSDVDIFLYNTKSDDVSINQLMTKVAILAGTDSSLFNTAPYIAASYSTASNALDLHINNPSNQGAINILSDTGRVAINDIVFPTVAQTVASASNGRILRYFGTFPYGSLRWDDTNVTLASIGSSGITTNIVGNPVLINGYPIEFVDDNIVPFNVGGILAGSSFSADSFSNSVTGTYSDWPLVEVIRKILYPYISPVLTLSTDVNNTGLTFAELGTTPSVVVNASMTTYARQYTEAISDFIITGTTYSVGGFGLSATPGTIAAFTASGNIYGDSLSTVNYVFAVTDVFGITALSYPSYFSYSATSSIEFIPPIVASFVSDNTISFGPTGTGLSIKSPSEIIISGLTVSGSRLVKRREGNSQIFEIPVNGNGYLYFYYPSSYGTVSQIKDPNGFVIHDSGNLTYSNFVSPTSNIPISYVNSGLLSASVSYGLYRTSVTCSYTGTSSFQLIF